MCWYKQSSQWAIRIRHAIGVILFGLSLMLLFLTTACARSMAKMESSVGEELADGLYRIERSGKEKSTLLPLAPNERIITFNKAFLDSTEREGEFLVVRVDEFTPLELAQMPRTEDQIDRRKKLFLTMTASAKQQLKEFTSNNLNSRAAIVVNQEALTQHKIRMVVEDGALQITRCTDNACKYLYVELKDKVFYPNAKRQP